MENTPQPFPITKNPDNTAIQIQQKMHLPKLNPIILTGHLSQSD
jgi:hypothetical protein